MMNSNYKVTLRSLGLYKTVSAPTGLIKQRLGMCLDSASSAATADRWAAEISTDLFWRIRYKITWI